eukprot:s2353_g7.t1
MNCIACLDEAFNLKLACRLYMSQSGIEEICAAWRSPRSHERPCATRASMLSIQFCTQPNLHLQALAQQPELGTRSTKRGEEVGRRRRGPQKTTLVAAILR